MDREIGLADGFLHDLQFEREGRVRPEFVLHQPPWTEARILGSQLRLRLQPRARVLGLRYWCKERACTEPELTEADFEGRRPSQRCVNTWRRAADTSLDCALKVPRVNGRSWPEADNSEQDHCPGTLPCAGRVHVHRSTI